VTNSIGLLNPEGLDLWLSFEWADSTPTAPQLMCYLATDTTLPSVIGQKYGGLFQWQSTSFTPIMRCRYLSPFPIDTLVAGFRISPVRDVPAPDSFLVTACRGDGSMIPYTVSADTLMGQISGHDLDSIIIRAIYDDTVDDSGLVLIYNPLSRLPINSEICTGTEYAPGGTCELLLTNTQATTMTLSLGYNRQMLSCPSASIILEGHETRSIPFTALIGEEDSTLILITVRDTDDRYYPHVARTDYPFDEPLAIEDEPGDIGAPPAADFLLYPNPCRAGVHISPRRYYPGGRLEVYDILGRLITSRRSDGGEAVYWDTRDSHGRPVAAGVYVVRMIPDGGEPTVKKAVIIR
jgi:hypothetical protein